MNFFGSVRLGDNVTVGRDMVIMFGALRTASSVSVNGNRVVQPAWIFWGPLLIIILIVYVIVREIRNQRRRHFARSYPFPPR